MKQTTKKLFSKIALIALFYMPNVQLTAQTINNESFDNATFLPVGWASIGSTTLWSRRTTGTFPTCAPLSGAGMARFSSRAQTAGTNQTIATPVVDYSSRNSSPAYFSFWIYRDNGSVNSDSISVYINTSASLTGAAIIGMVSRYSKLSIPDTVAINGWYKYSFNVPSKYTGNSNFFLIKGISQNGYNIYMDDVQWNSYPNLCTGKPTPGIAVATSALFCGGSGSTTINLSGQSSGLSGLSYQWKSATAASGPWTKVGTNATSLNTGLINSTQYYQCVINCANSGLSDSTPVISVVVKSTANPIIAVSPLNANYCAGTKGVKLTATGASTYSWTPVTGLNISNSDTVLASPTISTLYTVRGTDTAGCSAQTTVVVNLRQAPVVLINSPDTVMCQGDSLLLIAQSGGGGGNTYLWAPSGKTTTSVFAKPLVDTKYNVTATNTFGCKGTANKNIYVVQKPIANFAANITGRTYTFFDSSLNAQNLLWDFGDGNSSTNKNPVYTYSFDGTKTVTLIAFNPPCASDTFQKTFNVSGLSAIHYSKWFELYPNPASDLLTINFKTTLDVNSQINFLDITGRKIYLPFTISDNGESLQVNTSALNPGHFYFEIISSANTYKGSFVIVH